MKSVAGFAGKSVLVTGAASGIGRETALAFANQGADLVLCDVQASALDAIAAAVRSKGRDVFSRVVDVSKRDAMQTFSKEVAKDVGVVDVLVNNAGVGLGGGFLDTTLDDWDWIVSINLMGVVHGCHFFVPPMVDRGRGGHVVNVSSVAGFFATEQLAAYSATKFAVLGLSEALRDELRRHSIGVTTICPGIVDTAITRTMRARGPVASREARAGIEQMYKKRNFGPDKVAHAIVQAVKNKRSVVPVTPEAWALYFGKRISPDLVATVGRAIAKRSGIAEKRASGAT